MHFGGRLELERLGSLHALSLKRADEALAFRIHESNHTSQLLLIFFIRATPVTGRQAHAHLRVDASWVRRVWI